MIAQYVIARTRSNRPSLQHALSTGPNTLNVKAEYMTACGIYMYGWSRAYQNKVIPEIFCYRCAKKLEKR